MSDPFLFILGALLVLVVFYDFLRTTISLSGMGLISRGVTSCLWSVGSQLAVTLERRTNLSIRGLLGPFILIAIAGTWVLLHLAGYVLMYRSGLSLIQSQSGDPASLVQTVAFAGSALSTLGASTVKVTGGWWDILSMAAAVNGMIVLTLSVSFVLNILQTTNNARIFATRFHILKQAGAQGPIMQMAPELIGVAVKLAASPLPGVFVPQDQMMDFPKAVLGLCDMVQADTGCDTMQMEAALALLGRHMRTSPEGDDIKAVRSWAHHYSISADVTQ